MHRHILIAALLLGGCKKDLEPEDPFSETSFSWEVADMYGVANLDDDNKNDKRDWLDDARHEDDDDLVVWELPEELGDAINGGHTLTVTLSGDTDKLKLWSGDVVALDEETPSLTMSGSVLPDLAWEFGDFVASGTLTLTHTDTQGAEVQSQEVRLLGAPLILNHHLLAVERAYGVTDYPYNEQMMTAISDLMGSSLKTDEARDYQYDVWVQDEFETATLTAPSGRIDVVIDSIRSDGYGLDDFPEEVVAKKTDYLVRTWGSGTPTSQDSFGDLEASPPVEVNGVSYPFGRIYYGELYGQGPTDKLTDFLEDQKVQDPFALNISWLCVGHVDEFTTFLPDPNAPKGFRLYVGDAAEGLAFIDGLDPNYALPRYDSGHQFATIGEMQEDMALRALNEDYQRDAIEPNLDILKAELGLDEEDIVRIPALYEEQAYCGPYGLALIPGTVNMLVITQDDGTVDAFLPDPFMREDGVAVEDDPFVQAVEALLPQGVTPYWVDDWNTYHLMWGEVHCGTNTTRTPDASWWLDAMHLLDEE